MASRAESERQLATFAPRQVCSDAERRAAVWLHDDLRARGHEAWLETHWIRPHLAAAVALDCALAAIGGLIAIGAPVAGLVVAAIGALSLALDVAGLTSAPRLLMPRRATQVVLVAPPPRRAAAKVELLLVARTDVPRSVMAQRLAAVPGGLWWLAVAALAVVAAAMARLAGAEGTLLGALQLVPTVLLLVAIGGALDAATARLGDGRAEDAALAAALDAHESLVREPSPEMGVGLLLAPPGALRAHLRREKLPRDRTALLYVRPGDVRSRHPQWRAAASAAGLNPGVGGARGLPAALVSPDDAERLARGLGETL
jgi:hypothetical protein